MSPTDSRIRNLEQAYLVAQCQLEKQMRAPKTADHLQAERERDGWKERALTAERQRDEWEATCKTAWENK